MTLKSEPSMTETVFLETRFQILAGVYSPGSIIDRDDVCREYGVSAKIVLDAFRTLLVEGYVEATKRSVYVAHSWDRSRLSDQYEMWAYLSSVAGSRCAERGSVNELKACVSLLSKPDSFDFASSEGVDRHISELSLFNAELVRLSKDVSLLGLAQNFVPNALRRHGVFCSSAKQLKDDRKALVLVSDLLLQRNSASVRQELQKLILRSLPDVERVLLNLPARSEPVLVKRFDGNLNRKGCQFGLGVREPSLDGIIYPYGFVGR
jgi:DNA-binding GntR family transcriptional regulator